MALTVIMVVIAMLASMAGYVTQLGYNQRKLSDAMGGTNTKAYYHAMGGVVNAHWRIRTNYVNGLAPAGTFVNDAYNPGPYNLDVDGNGTNDTTIDIGPVQNPLLKNRPIQVIGCENAVPC